MIETSIPAWGYPSSAMRHRIFAHVAWTTRARVPMIDRELAEFLSELLPRIAHGERAELLCLGMVTTHAHVLVRLNPKTEIPRLLQRFKGSSAFIAKKERNRVLHWAQGYNLESVGALSLARAWKYVGTQHLRHPHEAIDGWPPEPEAPIAISARVTEYLQRLDSLR